MSLKTFFLQVELDIQAITCPGVWLCSNGKISLQIYLLESCVQTRSHQPYFPVQLNEKFVFYKTFAIKHRLNALHKKLNNECVYIELIQWKSCETGNVLATFQTTLNELLYPTTRAGSIPGIDIDLLMEPTKCFPGKIAPKIELNTKTTLDEKICNCTPFKANVVNPKILSSTIDKPPKLQSRKVCHSIGYSRRKYPLKSMKRPPFRYRKADDYLILRKPQYDVTVDHQRRCWDRNLEKSKLSNYRNNCCTICSKYHGYFRLPSDGKKCADNDSYCECLKSSQQNRNHGERCCCCCCDNNETIADINDCDNGSSGKASSLAEQLHKKLNDTLEALSEPECYCFTNN